MSKIKLPAILLNNDFYSKPRNKKWIKEHGFEAIAILHVVWIAISQEKDCKLKIEETEFLDYPAFFNFEKITTVLNSAIEVGLLEKDENSYFNSQITDKFNKFKKKREIYQQNADRRWQKDDAKENAIAYSIAQKNDSDLQCKSTLPLSLTLPLDINKNSAPDLPPEIDGRKQCKNGKFVYLSEIEKELLISNYASEGIEKTVISEAIFILSEHIEKNINAPNSEDYLRKGQQKAFEMLSKSWVKDEARKKQTNKINLETSQKRADYRRAVNATEGKSKLNNSPPKGSQVADLIKNLSAQKAVA